MARVARAVHDRFDVRLGHAVERVVITDGRVTGVLGVTVGGKRFDEGAELVAVATPATIAADVLSSVAPLARELRNIEYRPVATAVVEYSDIHFPGNVGGLFLPRGSALSHVAKYDDSNRVRFSFAGVAARRAMSECSIERLVHLGEQAFQDVGGRLGQRRSFAGNVWRPGLCGQSWMHHRTLQSLTEHGKLVRGLALAGDYLRGNSLEACVIAAEESVRRLLDEPRASVTQGARSRGLSDLASP
jgi:oxygen-dependent protoporphyrinogen oxidase